MTPTDPRTPAEPGTPGEGALTDPDSNDELRALLAATAPREPAPERVRGWQAALRELPPPTRSGYWASGPEWPAWPEPRLAVADPATRHRRPTTVIGWPPEGPADSEEDSAGSADGPADSADGPAGSAEGPHGSTESLGPAANSLRVATEDPVIVGHTTSATASEARADDAPGSVDDPHPPSECPPPKAIRSIMLGPAPTPLSCDRPDGARRPANIRFAAARRPAAMATGPLTMADAGVAVAKIRRGQPRSGMAAAIGGLAAAIIAVAVLIPSVATGGHSGTDGESSAATAAGSAEGPAATAAGLSKDPSAGWPLGPPGALSSRPSDHSGASSPRLSGRSADPEPLTLSRAQPLAAPPSGQDLGPLAAPGALPRCLVRFGSAAQPVASRRVVLDGRAGVLLVLPTDLPGRLRLLVVDARCTTALADDMVGR